MVEVLVRVEIQRGRQIRHKEAQGRGGLQAS